MNPCHTFEGNVELGIIKGTLAKAIKDEKYKPFFPHRTGHWIGMDVHDVGDYKVDGAWRLLEPGMVLTKDAPKKVEEIEQIMSRSHAA